MPTEVATKVVKPMPVLRKLVGKISMACTYMTTKLAVQLNLARTQTSLTAKDMEGVRAKAALKARQAKLKRRSPECDRRRPAFSCIYFFF